MGQLQIKALVENDQHKFWEDYVSRMLEQKQLRYGDDNKKLVVDSVLTKEDVMSLFKIDEAWAQDIMSAFDTGLRLESEKGFFEKLGDKLKGFLGFDDDDQKELVRDDRITFNEFVATLTLLAKGSGNQKMEFLFTFFDSAPQDGHLDLRELKAMIRCLLAVTRLLARDGVITEDQRAEMYVSVDEAAAAALVEADKDGDKKISLEEFKEYCQKGDSTLGKLLDQIGRWAGQPGLLTAETVVMPKQDNLFRIVSCDGGGLRGLMAAAFLCELDKRAPGCLNNVQMYAGTSTGSIIGGLLAMNYSPEQVLNLYRTNGPKVFDEGKKGVGAPGSSFSNEYLVKLAKDLARDRTLADVYNVDGHHLLIPTFNLGRERRQFDNVVHWGPKVYHTFNRKDDPDAQKKVWELVVASSAAPSYFPPFMNEVDGGLVMNNPTVAAVAQAINARYGATTLPNVRVLSVGTGFFPTTLEASDFDMSGLGVLPRIKSLIDAMMDGEVQASDYIARAMLGDGYLRCFFQLPQAVELSDTDPLVLQQLVDLGAKNEPMLNAAVKWLRQCGWLNSCTYASSGRRYLAQPVYTCEQCDMTGVNGAVCCEECFRQCHAGHTGAFFWRHSSGAVCACGSSHQSSCRALPDGSSSADQPDNFKATADRPIEGTLDPHLGEEQIMIPEFFHYTLIHAPSTVHKHLLTHVKGSELAADAEFDVSKCAGTRLGTGCLGELAAKQGRRVYLMDCSLCEGATLCSACFERYNMTTFLPHEIGGSGKIIIAVMFATWNGPSIWSMGRLSDLQRKFLGWARVVAISNEPSDVLRQFVKKHHEAISFTVARSSEFSWPETELCHDCGTRTAHGTLATESRQRSHSKRAFCNDCAVRLTGRAAVRGSAYRWHQDVSPGAHLPYAYVFAQTGKMQWHGAVKDIRDAMISGLLSSPPPPRPITVRQGSQSVSVGVPGLRWVACQDKAVPKDALKYAQESNGQPLYICRSWWPATDGLADRGLVLGKFGEHLASGGVSLPYGNAEVTGVSRYEILCVSEDHLKYIKWVSGRGGEVLPGAVVGGYESADVSSGRLLYVGVGSVGGGKHPGKMGSHLGGCLVPYGGREKKVDYELLVYEPPKEAIQEPENFANEVLQQQLEAAKMASPGQSQPAVVVSSTSSNGSAPAVAVTSVPLTQENNDEPEADAKKEKKKKRSWFGRKKKE